ncbi:IS200/IS605 family accessory protein TnpB-related protein [Geminocystis herdmanii]|uniref:IS200/IS605 family accessory protein TnpB-related protein n=1 Tax=Geminocystis herdmanii TaxID=669359 RepID=UPI00034D145F|nr:IS200/IS605 family accessory protein TnpB-related protein [Geminocystis herdmanii]
MSKITYQTLLNTEVTEFCDLIGGFFGKIERDLYKDLEKGKKLNYLKKSYQIKYGINARQFNSIHIILKGKIASRKECYKSQIKQTELKIKGLEKTIETEKKKLAKLPLSCGRNQKSVRSKLRFTIHQKQRKLATLKDRLVTLKKNKPSLVFGGKKLWYAQFNLKENGYSSHEEWLKDWQKTRSSQFTLVGSKDETNGNQNCQLLPQGLKIRVPPCYESIFGKYYLIENVKFSYGQSDVNYALNNQQALTFRFVKKGEKWYLYCSFDLPETPIISYRKNGMLGIDLNPNIIGWSYVDNEGNLKAKGQIKINVRDKSTNQTTAIIGDAVKKLVKLAYQYECPISVENLDFERKKATMKEEGVKYSRMLSNFAYSCFLDMLNSCAFKHGIEVIKVNPAFSSLIGLTKFMRLYGLSSDTAAALVLARRALRKKESIPTNYARLIQVDSSRHVWSFWNALNKKLKGVKRHSFFSVSNREVEVKLLDELHSNRFNSKSKDTFTAR